MTDLIKSQEKKEFFDACRDYAKDLRTWLLAFGIAAPALFVSDKFLQLQNVANSRHEIQFITHLFLAGVVLQLLLVLVNKYANYYGYAESEKNLVSNAFRAITNKFWIDVLIDVASIILFSVATFYLYALLA